MQCRFRFHTSFDNVFFAASMLRGCCDGSVLSLLTSRRRAPVVAFFVATAIVSGLSYRAVRGEFDLLTVVTLIAVARRPTVEMLAKSLGVLKTSSRAWNVIAVTPWFSWPAHEHPGARGLTSCPGGCSINFAHFQDAQAADILLVHGNNLSLAPSSPYHDQQLIALWAAEIFELSELEPLGECVRCECDAVTVGPPLSLVYCQTSACSTPSTLLDQAASFGNPTCTFHW